MIVYVALAVLAVLVAITIIATARRWQSAKAIAMVVSKETSGDNRSNTESLLALGGKASAEEIAVERAAKAIHSATIGGADSGSIATSKKSAAKTELYQPLDPETIGVNRRQFFNRTIVMLMGMSLSGFGAACIAFLWPQGASGFGAKIKVGLVSDLLNEIRDNNGFLYKPEGRMWLTEYPNGAVEKAIAAYSDSELTGMTAGQQLGLSSGIVALYQKCPHLGCRVPSCPTSQWFECPCHGSKYNQVGEKRGGPAPRGMDRFAVEVTADGSLIVDTGTIIQGPPIGTNTTGQEAEGPNCIGQVDASH